MTAATDQCAEYVDAEALVSEAYQEGMSMLIGSTSLLQTLALEDFVSADETVGSEEDLAQLAA